MTKTVSLNDFTYSSVAVLAGKLTSLAEKPISLGMTIHLAVAYLDFEMTTKPQIQKKIKEVYDQALSPEQFDQYWDTVFKRIGTE